MVKSDTWRRVVCLHIATAVPAITFAVVSTQCVIPFAGAFAAAAAGKEATLCGLEVGLLVGIYTFGRAVATPFWLWVVRWCGQRAALQICLLVQFVLTLCFGLSITLESVVILRFWLGAFSPGYALARDILVAQLAQRPEDIPPLGVFSMCTQVLMHATGLILGALVVQRWDLPYLEVCLVNVIIILFAFAIVSTDFPEDPIVTKVIIRPMKLGQFQKFKEEIPTSSDETNADVPSYLAQYVKSNFPKLDVLKEVFEPDIKPESPNHGDVTMDSEIRQTNDTLGVDPGVKRTHISFMEDEIAESTPEQTVAVKLDDPFSKSIPRGTLHTANFRVGLSVYVWVVFATTAIEYSGFFWLITKVIAHESAPKQLGIALAGAAVLVGVLEPIFMSHIATVHSLNKTATMGMLVAAFGAAALPFTSYLGGEIWTLPCLVVLMVIRNSGAQMALTVMVLRLGQAVSMDVRSKALKWADWVCCFAKALGILCGPGLLSLGFSLQPDLSFLFSGVSAAVCLFTASVIWTTAPKYPRLSQVPYCM